MSDQFDRASDQLEANKNTLNQQIQMLTSCWDGTTCSRFYYEFEQAYRDMKLTIEHMQLTSQELKRIAYKFMQVDNEQGQLDPRCAAPQILNPAGTSNVHYGKAIEVKSFGDQLKDLGDEAKDFAKGAKSGAAEMWGAVEDKANALVEDPIGTGKQMAYDVTIGTAEEVLNTTIWGAKMAFDVGDTREKFDERIQAEQERMNEMGKSAYLGQQGAMALGAFALNRIGIKNMPNLMPDSGGDGGKGQGADIKANPNGTIVKDGNKTIYTNPAGNELTWVDQHPKNINRDIDNALQSSNVGKATEAKVADFVRKEVEVKGFGQKVLKDNGESAGDLDVVTNNAIIEVKASIKSVKEDQFNKLIDAGQDNFFNSDHKKVILYIDKPMNNLRPEHKTMLEEIESKGVIIVNSLVDLKEVIK
ncbi:WXG100 family type VII secretion target [Paenibacillus lautus]|nr:WXG100 family type VII secretion target [Paenibacillus lautus]